MSIVLRYAAFTEDPSGGNPAGIVLDAEDLDDAAMQAIATDLDYPETAFITERAADSLRVRYFSPGAEVPFCGHATVATAVALVEHGLVEPGKLTFRTPVGPVLIETARDGEAVVARFTSVEPRLDALAPEQLRRILDGIGLTEASLDPRFPPAISYAGNPHPIVAVTDRAEFDGFTFDPVEIRSLLDAEGWPATITVIHAPDVTEVHARNLFPVGRITEDPATGSAAASVGAYLRELRLVEPPASVVIHQGGHVGRPSILLVDIPETGGISVTGTARAID